MVNKYKKVYKVVYSKPLFILWNKHPFMVFGNTVQLVFQSVFYLKNIKLIICLMFFNNFKVMVLKIKNLLIFF